MQGSSPWVGLKKPDGQAKGQSFKVKTDEKSKPRL